MKIRNSRWSAADVTTVLVFLLVVGVLAAPAGAHASGERSPVTQGTDTVSGVGDTNETTGTTSLSPNVRELVEAA